MDEVDLCEESWSELENGDRGKRGRLAAFFCTSSQDVPEEAQHLDFLRNLCCFFVAILLYLGVKK